MDVLGTVVTMVTAVLAILLIVTIVREGLSPVVRVEAVDQRILPDPPTATTRIGDDPDKKKAPDRPVPGSDAPSDSHKQGVSPSGDPTPGKDAEPPTDTAADGSAAVEAAIRSEFDRFREEGGGQRLDIVESSDPRLGLPEVLPKTTGWGQLIEILLVLIPRRVYTAHTVIGQEGSGLFAVATLRGPRDVTIGTRTIRERDYSVLHDDITAPTSQRVAAMATLAASWAAYSLAERLQRRHLPGLLSRDWESYGLFRLGAQWNLDGRSGQARRAYLASLRKDPENRGAAFNLAVQQAVQLCDGPAVQRFAAVLRWVEDAAVRRRVHFGLDRLWHRASYNAGVAYFHEYLRVSSGDAGDPTCRTDLRMCELLVNAEKHAASTLIMATQVMAGVRSRGEHERSYFHDLSAFLEMTRWASLVLLADIWGSQERKGFSKRRLEEVKAVVRYKKGAGTLTEDAALIESLASEEPLGVLPARVRYNLACYYATRNRRRALQELRFGLDAVSPHWALIDPSLDPLRARETCRLRFEALVREYLPPILLRRLPGANAPAADQVVRTLEKASITDHMDLVQASRAATAGKVSGLSLTDATVADLIDLANLTQLVDRSLEAVQLLYSVGVRSCDALRHIDENRLKEARAMPGYQLVKTRLPVWQARGLGQWTLRAPVA